MRQNTSVKIFFGKHSLKIFFKEIDKFLKFLAFVFGYLVGKISEFVYPTGFQIGYVEWQNSFERAFSSVNPKIFSTKLQSFEGYFFGKNYELMGKVRLKKININLF